MSGPLELPRVVDIAVVPTLSVAAAFGVAGVVVMAIGESPLVAIGILLKGALGSGEGIGFTLYYATSFMLTGLAVAIAFHAGLFNIGGEGQAMLGGLGVALAALNLEFLPGVLLIPVCILAAAAFGAAWGAVPGWLQARRGSHVVIVTIMFNFIAATLLVYLLVEVIGKPGSMQPETRNFASHAVLPKLHEMAAWMGLSIPRTPVNASLFLALGAVALVHVIVTRSRLGYAIRTVGANPNAALYAGMPTARITIVAMALAGACAGLMAVNEIMGAQGRLILDFTGGYGFVGIAVALMGRAHAGGIVLAALLFGVLYQGSAELAFEKPAITRDMALVIGGVIVLFAGALEGLFRRPLVAIFARRSVVG